MSPPERACLVLAILAGGFVANVELHTTEATATLALVVLLGLLLGFACRRLFWLWAVVVGGAVPAAYIIANILQSTPRELPQPEGIVTDVGVGAFTVATAIVAAGIGAAIARVTSSAQSSPPAS